MIEIDFSKIPLEPGVYIYKNSRDEIIYIGKAKKLRNRMRSYFSSDHKHSPKTQFLVKNICSFDFIVVDNELEALLLENKLIKKHKPKYNINLKDSKTYAYLKLTNEELPHIEMTRKVLNDGAEYFGPYLSSSTRRELFDLVQSLFFLLSKKTYATKSSLNYEIGKTLAKSIEDINKEEYLSLVSQARDFLKGKGISSLVKKLESEMNLFAHSQKFEQALEKKQQIEAILSLQERQKVDKITHYDQDVVVVLEEETSAIILVFNISRGVISGKKKYVFKEVDDNLFEEFLKMYYSRTVAPKEVLTNVSNMSQDNVELLERYLSSLRGSKVELKVPQKGEKKALVDMAIKNAKLSFLGDDVLSQLQNKLSLKQLPRVIECFDMSNLGKDFLVGAMTRFVDEQEDRPEWRWYEIKSFSGKNDDYAAMEECVFRRYLAISEGREVRGDFPDLLIIDGGKGQLKASMRALSRVRSLSKREVRERLEKMDIISIAKGEKRDRNEIYKALRDEPLVFDDNSEMMLYLRRVRDSVHNHVLRYNRKKRDMRVRSEFKN